MLGFWKSTPVPRRIAWLILVVAIFGTIGVLIWHYPTWPMSVLVLVAIILNIVGRPGNGRTRNAQENDPNKR